MRNHDVSRVEGFSDAVFGFALALLVVSLDTPENVSDLLSLTRGFLPFALTFAMVGWIWYQHNVFFRRYGLQDAWTIFLNLALLFVVLFYVYPLKFLAGQLVNRITGAETDFGNLDQSRMLMVLYSGGVVLIFACFLLLHRQAWKRRGELGLSARELTQLTYDRRAHAISMGLGVLSLVLVAISARLSGVAGLIYILMGPLHAWNGKRLGTALARLD